MVDLYQARNIIERERTKIEIEIEILCYFHHEQPS